MCNFLSVAEKLTQFDCDGEQYAVAERGWLFLIKTFKKNTPISEIMGYVRDAEIEMVGFDCNLIQKYPVSYLEKWDFLLPEHKHLQLIKRYGEDVVKILSWDKPFDIYTFLDRVKKKYPDTYKDVGIFGYQCVMEDWLIELYEKRNGKE